MHRGGPPGVLPLRPLTTAEVLDSAVSLLRAYSHVLLPAGVLLATAEQLALAPLRTAAGAQPPAYLPGWDRLFGLDGEAATYWLLLAAGCGTETLIIALLAALGARGAAADVLGHRLAPRRLLDPRGARGALVVLVAAATGLLTFLAALLGPLWAAGYALVGLAVPALVVERIGPGGALVRGAVLACRSGLRAGAVRVLGYVTWLGVRLVLGLGGAGALREIELDPGWTAIAAMLIWPLVNAVAYPALACLDAALYLETRMRTEGLDIRLVRLARRYPRVPHDLEVVGLECPACRPGGARPGWSTTGRAGGAGTAGGGRTPSGGRAWRWHG